MSQENKTKTLVNFFYEIGTLRKIQRAHRQTLLTNDETDNIASHSFRVAIVGWFLAKAENADPYKVVMMCLLHDSPESRSGDQNWIHKKYVKVYEDEIIQEQIGNLPFNQELFELTSEYQKREMLESQIAKDADLLDQVLILREHAWTGNQEAVKWLEGKEQGKRLVTPTAKKWVKEICQQRPSEWWDNLWTSERR